MKNWMITENNKYHNKFHLLDISRDFILFLTRHIDITTNIKTANILITSPAMPRETRKLLKLWTIIASIRNGSFRNIDFPRIIVFPYPYPINADTDVCSRHPPKLLIIIKTMKTIKSSLISVQFRKISSSLFSFYFPKI